MPDPTKFILLVEDNPRDVQLIKRSLATHGIANCIDVVTDGAQALDYLFCRGPYADRDPALVPVVILLDLKLPKVDGFEVLAQVRSDPRTCHIPVVILTSSSLDEDLVRSYESGANSYVRKPVDFLKFHEKTRQIGLYWLVINEPPPNNHRARSQV
jgi:CheY-like chemotaxis protein